MLQLQPKKRHDGAHRHTYRGSRKTISVLCLISGLEHGGTEVMLYRFLSGMDRTRYSAQVISMIGAGPYGNPIQELGVPLWSLECSGAFRTQWVSCGLFAGFGKPALMSFKRGCTTLIFLAAWRRSWLEIFRWHGAFHQSDMSREGNGWLTLRTIALCSRMFTVAAPSRVHLLLRGFSTSPCFSGLFGEENDGHSQRF